MKKVLLSSVAALAVFAAASPVFANNEGYLHTGDLNNKEEVKADNFFGEGPAELKPYAKEGLNNADADSTKAKFKAAGEDLKPVPGKPGEFVVTGKAKAAKAAGKDAAKPGAAKAAGQKALPKPSAAK